MFIERVSTGAPNQNGIIKLKNLGDLNFSTTAPKCWLIR